MNVLFAFTCVGTAYICGNLQASQLASQLKYNLNKYSTNLTGYCDPSGRRRSRMCGPRPQPPQTGWGAVGGALGGEVGGAAGPTRHRPDGDIFLLKRRIQYNMIVPEVEHA